MKKAVLTLIILVLVLSGTPSGPQESIAASPFSDVPETAWYKKDLEYVTKDSRKMLEGYNGRFFPGDTLTIEQFLKIVTVASGFTAPAVQPGVKWSQPFIEKAVTMKLVLGGEFTDYNRGITRAEMARIIIRVLPSITGETATAYDSSVMKSKMTDYSTISESLKDYVCQAYQLGILTGGTDSKFNPGKTLVRAEAAAVIHRLLDKGARKPLEETEAASEIWSDAEFEAFMKSSEVKEYVNTYPFMKVENRNIYFRSLADPTKATLVSDKNDPGINEMVYNIYKIIAYHTKKTDGYMMAAYQDEHDSNYVRFKFYVGKNDHQYIPNGAIELWIYPTPRKSPTADKYFPGKQKGDTHYEWILGSLHSDNDLSDYEPGMDRRKFEWTMPRYEQIFRDMCQEVYGAQQGNALYQFSLNEVDTFFLTEDDYLSDYIGFYKEIGCEVVYHCPEGLIAGLRFSTDKPEAKK